MKNAGKYLMVSAVVIVVAQKIGEMIGNIRAGVSPFFNFSFYDLFIQIVAAGIVALIGLILYFLGTKKESSQNHSDEQQNHPKDSAHAVDRTTSTKRIKNGLLLLLAALATIFALYSCSKSNEASPSSTTGASHNQSIGTTQTTSGITVYITKTGEKYHRSWCQYLSNSKIPISLEKAVQRGYGRCSKCDPPRLTTTEKTRYTIAQNDGFVFSPTNSIPYLTMPTQPTVNVPTFPQTTISLPSTTPRTETASTSTPTTVLSRPGYILSLIHI